MTYVQSYLEQDKSNLIAGDEQDEWKRKATALGLEGQLGFLETAKSPNPFKRLTRGDLAVVTFFCPDVVDLKDYKHQVIPLEAMSLALLATHDNHFEKLRCYYHAGKQDPFIVGFNGNEAWLIAQWGPERLSWDELVMRAKAGWKEQSKAKLEQAIATAQSQMQSLDALANEHFNGGWIHLVS